MHIASRRSSGLLAQLKWRYELRQLEGALEWEGAASVSATSRRQAVRGTALVPGLGTVSALFFSGHALTLARAVHVLGLGAGGAIAIIGFELWYARRVETASERLYLRWLQRARPARSGPAARSVVRFCRLASACRGRARGAQVLCGW